MPLMLYAGDLDQKASTMARQCGLPRFNEGSMHNDPDLLQPSESMHQNGVGPCSDYYVIFLRVRQSHVFKDNMTRRN